MSIIYRLTSPSGKHYVGKHRYDDPQVRFEQHIGGWQRWIRDGRPRREYQTKLYYAFDKYPPNEWTIDVECYIDEDYLGIYEEMHIKIFDSVENGYNLTAGGGLLNLELSEGHKEKIGTARSEYYETEDGKAWLVELSKRMKEHNPGAEANRGKPAWNSGKKCPQISEGKKRADQTYSITQTKERNSKYWIVTYPGGEETRIKNLIEFSKQNNLNRYCMYNVAAGKNKQHKGFKVRLDQ
jgi:hypothetical protein